jgi:hypothetical protein
MTNTFTNAAIEVGITPTTLYTCPPNTQSIVHNLHLANQDNVNAATVGIQFFQALSSDTFVIGNAIPLGVGSALEFDKPINLNPGDSLNIIANNPGLVVAFASVLQIT